METDLPHLNNSAAQPCPLCKFLKSLSIWVVIFNKLCLHYLHKKKWQILGWKHIVTPYSPATHEFRSPTCNWSTVKLVLALLAGLDVALESSLSATSMSVFGWSVRQGTHLVTTQHGPDWKTVGSFIKSYSGNKNVCSQSIHVESNFDQKYWNNNFYIWHSSIKTSFEHVCFIFTVNLNKERHWQEYSN